MSIDGKILVTALEDLGLARDTDLTALIQSTEDSTHRPMADLLLRLVPKVAAVAAEVAEARKAARQVAEAEARWEVVGVARSEALFQDGRGRTFTVPEDLARAIAQGANLDAAVTFEEQHGLPFTMFAYSGRRVAIPSSLLRQLAPAGVPGRGSPTPTSPAGSPGANPGQVPADSRPSPAPGGTR